MSYMYRNKKTNEVITTSNRVRGKNWEPVEENVSQQPPVDENPEEDFVVDELPEEETAVVGAPAEKPKAPRRGKK